VYLDLIQIKTKKPITVGIIDPTVLEFLRRDFPQKTNASVFNKKIKELCRLAGIDQVIRGNKMSSVTKRVEFENPNKDAVADMFMERLRRLGNESG
jgi:hypothetical protein